MTQVSLNPIASNFVAVEIGKLMVWFSYKTPIAYRILGSAPVVRKNSWGCATGKHLNMINTNAEARLDSDVFEAQLIRVLEDHNISI